MDRELIKKALECCVDCHTICNSEKCYLFDKFEYSQCAKQLKKDSLTLINELESENERLNECYKVKAYDKLRAENNQLKDRIAELEKENAKYKQKLTTNQWVQEIRKEALKQFAERLKEKYGKSCSEYYPLLLELTSEQLDETLKECINE